MDASVFLALVLACAPQVHADTARALVSVESAFNPWAIGVVGGALLRQPRNRAEALATAKALKDGGWNFSVGLGQINVGNFDRLGLTVESAFEPCANLAAMQTVLHLDPVSVSAALAHSRHSASRMARMTGPTKSPMTPKARSPPMTPGSQRTWKRFARSAAGIGLSGSALERFAGDATDAGDVARALDGIDVVVQALGMGIGTYESQQYVNSIGGRICMKRASTSVMPP